jgi:hypothetical protein
MPTNPTLPQLGPNIDVGKIFDTIQECFRIGCHASGTPDIAGYLTNTWLWITWIGYIVTVLGLVVVVYTMIRLYDLRKREKEQLEELIISPETEGPNPRWEHIESLMAGDKPSDWRQAIIEADIILDEMLTRQGYAGDGVGEKLKKIEASDFNTLQDAWEAHKVRNQIAHQGSNFNLSVVLARRTIAQYETVFREFKFI